MVHAKYESPDTINNAANTIFNFSFISFFFIWARGVSYWKLQKIALQCVRLFYSFPYPHRLFVGGCELGWESELGFQTLINYFVET